MASCVGSLLVVPRANLRAHCIRVSPRRVKLSLGIDISTRCVVGEKRLTEPTSMSGLDKEHVQSAFPRLGLAVVTSRLGLADNDEHVPTSFISRHFEE